MSETELTKTPLDGLPSSGVEALIERLRDQGVADGRRQADELIAEARHEAEAIVAEAKYEAESILRQAREDAEMVQHAGEEALQTAMRDTVLKMKGHLSTRFSEEVRRLVAADMAQEAFLERLILEVAGRARRDAGLDRAEAIEILLPEDVVGLEELRRHPEKLREGSLSHFVLSVANGLLRDGVELRSSDRLEGGIRISLQGGEIQVDLTPDKVAEVLLEHLHPRFRAILEGTVK
ncbi:MAG: HrpE/YscL family type III secretion apparatus protein [Candidatus Thiodiazotropha sp.]